jgi:mono/diheme cytochrome c family protein
MLVAAPGALADSASTADLSRGYEKFSEQGGPALYSNVCQACHMANGEGAVGAGRYPSLAGNPKLEVAGYPLTLVLRGQGGMPAIGEMMDDTQVAAVVNYVRTHFGNAYADALTPADVAQARQAR